MRIAIIDLGTNTFNILIVKINHIKSYTNLYQSKISVKLGEGGINKNYIEPVPFQRGIEALKTYKETMERFYVEKVFAFATSAIRSASNGKEFVEAAKREAGIDVTMISGEKEAELIYYGVRNALKFSDKASLITRKYPPTGILPLTTLEKSLLMFKASLSGASPTSEILYSIFSVSDGSLSFCLSDVFSL